MEQVIDHLDESGKGAWLVAMILGFVVFWPIGLAILFYMIWSGRMGQWDCSGNRSWYQGDRSMNRDERRSERRSRRRCGRSRHRSHRTSGNTAFDAYREDTLRRLEEEQEEFVSFLERLRQAKDKEEFDQFMAERKKTSDSDTNLDEAEPTG